MWSPLSAGPAADTAPFWSPPGGDPSAVAASDLLLALAVALAAATAVLVARGWESGGRTALAGILYGLSPLAIAALTGPLSPAELGVAPVAMLLVSELLLKRRRHWYLVGAALGVAAAMPPLQAPALLVPGAVAAVAALLLVAVLHPQGITPGIPGALRIVAVAVPAFLLALAYPLTVRVLGGHEVTATVGDNHTLVGSWLGGAASFVQTQVSSGGLLTLIAGGAVLAIAIDLARRSRVWMAVLPVGGFLLLLGLSLTGHSPFHLAL